MATYYYRAVTAAGRLEQGVQEGVSEKGIARKLQALGLVPVHIGLSQGDSATRRENWLSSFLNSSGTKSWSGLVGRRATSQDVDSVPQLHPPRSRPRTVAGDGRPRLDRQRGLRPRIFLARASNPARRRAT